MRILCAAAVLLLAACAEPMASESGVVPGNIGVFVKQDPGGVVVRELKERGPAEQAGVRLGDVVLRYNGEVVTDPEHFSTLVHDTRPGTVARLELLRNGEKLLVEVPVEQLRTTGRA
jgi:serine protease Do